MQIQPPIFYLRNSFQKSLKLAIGKKNLKEIEEIVSVDLTPNHIGGDFTFPVFEIAKRLKVDYSKLASDVAKNLKHYKKYVRGVEIVNGYINVTIKPKEFYADSLRYILNGNLLQETKKSKKIKTVILISEQIKTDPLVNQSVSQFINRLYILPSYTVKTVSINGDTPLHQTRSFLRQLIRAQKVKDFGNNVMAIHTSEDKYMLLQKQNKTPTMLLCQLTTLNNHIEKNNPTVIIFPPIITSQNIYQFLAIANALQIFKKGVRVKIINNSDIENKLNSYHFKTIKNLHREIGKILQDKLDDDLKTSIEIEDAENEVARFISYAPEVFRQLILQASPEIIINYSEICNNPVSKLCQSIKYSVSSEKKISKQLLLQAIYKVLDTSLDLFAFRQFP